MTGISLTGYTVVDGPRCEGLFDAMRWAHQMQTVTFTLKKLSACGRFTDHKIKVRARVWAIEVGAEDGHSWIVTVVVSEVLTPDEELDHYGPVELSYDTHSRKGRVSDARLPSDRVFVRKDGEIIRAGRRIGNISDFPVIAD